MSFLPKYSYLQQRGWRHMRISEAFYKIKLNVLLDTLIPKNILKIIKIYNFQGGLSDISANKTSLIVISRSTD